MKSKLKIGIVMAFGLDGQGGIARSMNTLVAALSKHGNLQINVFRTCGPNKFLRYTLSPALFILFAIKMIVGPVDVLHVNQASLGSFYRKYAYYKLALLLKIPYIIHLHGGGFKDFYFNLGEKNRNRLAKVFQRSFSVVVLGTTWKKFAEEQLGVDSNKISIINNAVEDPMDLHSNISPPGECDLILFLGRLGDNKGSYRLLEALSTDEFKYASWRCIVAGDGDLDRHKAFAADCGLDKKVEFPGWLDSDAVSALFAKCGIFILPSIYENQPMSVIEAMAWGRSIIVSPVGSLPDFIIDQVNALTVDPRDVRKISKALHVLIDDPGKRNRLGKSARATYESHFSPGRQSMEFLEIYNAAYTNRSR